MKAKMINKVKSSYLPKRMLCICMLPISMLINQNTLATTNTPESMHQLIVATQADLMVENIAKQQSISIIDESISAIIRNKGSEVVLTDNQRQQLAQLAQKNSVQLFNEISTEEAQAQMFGLYMHLLNSAYSQEDIDAQLKFFTSDAGKNLQTRQPQVLQTFGVNAFPIVLEHSKNVLQSDLGTQLETDVQKILNTK